MKKDLYMFPAVFDYAEDGISISFPDLPGCFSCADDDEEAFFMAKEAMRLWLLVAEDDCEEIPEPTPLINVETESNQKAVLIDVCLAAYREEYKSRAVKKTLTIPSWLNEMAERENINFSFTLQEALKEKLRL